MGDSLDHPEESETLSRGYVCNECLAVYLSRDDVERHTRQADHKDVVPLTILAYDRISDSKLVALFELPDNQTLRRLVASLQKGKNIQT